MGYKYEMREKPVLPSRQMKVKTVVSITCDGCGRDDHEEWEWMIPISVEAGERGEEGNQIVEKVYCDECCDPVLEALIALGFSTHYHGSTNFLEDPCVEHAYANCPTRQRARYGNIDPEEEAEYGSDD